MNTDTTQIEQPVAPAGQRYAYVVIGSGNVFGCRANERYRVASDTLRKRATCRAG